MITLECRNYSVSRKSAVALFKAAHRAGADLSEFTIRKANGEIAVYALSPDNADCQVKIGTRDVRVIPADLVVQTARLRVDAQRLRRNLDASDAMYILSIAPPGCALT
jgi:hypothetical protein